MSLPERRDLTSDRRALVCPRDGCGYRVFLAPDESDDWTCPDHGVRGVVQANRPYFGRSTADGPADGLTAAELAEYRAS